jgi:lipopolysaccharide biosynthesis glycosyltransferase
MCNLDALRKMGKELEMVAYINRYQMGFPEQDCINILCQGRIRLIDSSYNANSFTQYCIRPKIIHYAAMKEYKDHWAYKKYDAIELQFEESEGEYDVER